MGTTGFKELKTKKERDTTRSRLGRVAVSAVLKFTTGCGMRCRLCTCRCKRCCTENMRALWTTFALNTIFTLAQATGATAANSLALLGDTGTMFIDSATYAVNLAAEYYKAQLGARRSAVVEVVASAVSVVTLLGMTVFIMTDAIDRLASPDDEEDVDPVIMLFFTCFNLLIDIGMCISLVTRKSGGLAGLFSCGCCCSSNGRAMSATTTAPRNGNLSSSSSSSSNGSSGGSDSIRSGGGRDGASSSMRPASGAIEAATSTAAHSGNGASAAVSAAASAAVSAAASSGSPMKAAASTPSTADAKLVERRQSSERSEDDDCTASPLLVGWPPQGPPKEGSSSAPKLRALSAEVQQEQVAQKPQARHSQSRRKLPLPSLVRSRSRQHRDGSGSSSQKTLQYAPMGNEDDGGDDEDGDDEDDGGGDGGDGGGGGNVSDGGAGGDGEGSGGDKDAGGGSSDMLSHIGAPAGEQSMHNGPGGLVTTPVRAGAQLDGDEALARAFSASRASSEGQSGQQGKLHVPPKLATTSDKEAVAEAQAVLAEVDVAEAGGGSGAHQEAGSDGEHRLLPLGISTEQDLNLCSAFAHVLADTMRTLTVMACALLVWLGGFDSETTDAVGSLVVAVIILVISAYVALETSKQARLLLSAAAHGSSVIRAHEQDERLHLDVEHR